MVTFIPPYMGEEIKSNAERKMYDVLQEMDLKNAYVLHSLGLPRHRSKIYRFCGGLREGRCLSGD